MVSFVCCSFVVVFGVYFLLLQAFSVFGDHASAPPQSPAATCKESTCCVHIGGGGGVLGYMCIYIYIYIYAYACVSVCVCVCV